MDVQSLISKVKSMINGENWEQRYAGLKASIILSNRVASKLEGNKEVLSKYLSELSNEEMILKVSQDDEQRVRQLTKDLKFYEVSEKFID